jgi:hypothetical protein
MQSSRNPGVIEQFRVAKSNPAALIGGCLLGAFVPFVTFWVAHFELNKETLFSSFQPGLFLVLGGLVYSAKTVWQWGRLAFNCPWKATGFVLLIEGAMVTTQTLWLGVMALGYLMVINAVATGCTLTAGDKGKGKTRKRRRRPRKAGTPSMI